MTSILLTVVKTDMVLLPLIVVKTDMVLLPPTLALNPIVQGIDLSPQTWTVNNPPLIIPMFSNVASPILVVTEDEAPFEDPPLESNVLSLPLTVTNLPLYILEVPTELLILLLPEDDPLLLDVALPIAFHEITTLNPPSPHPLLPFPIMTLTFPLVHPFPLRLEPLVKNVTPETANLSLDRQTQHQDTTLPLSSMVEWLLSISATLPCL